MNKNSIFQTMCTAVDKSPAFSEFLAALPSPHTLAVRLDDRLSCLLTLENGRAVLLPTSSTTEPQADLELILFSESIRRFSNQSFTDVTSLLTALSSLAVQGYVRARPLRSLAELRRRGYASTIRRLGASPAHFILEMLSHRFSLLQPLLIAPTELALKKLRNFVQK